MPAPVIVIGDAMLDVTLHCRTRGVSPESQNVLVLKEGDRTYGPGGAANVAANVKSLGADVSLMCVTGTDYPGETLRAWLRGQGIPTYAAMYGKTTVKTRVTTPSGQLLRIDSEQIVSPYRSEQWYDWREDGSGEPNIFLEQLQMLFRAGWSPDIQATMPPVFALVDYGKGLFDISSQGSLLWWLRSWFPKSPVIVEPCRGSKWIHYACHQGIVKGNLAQACQCLLSIPRVAREWRKRECPLEDMHSDHFYGSGIYMDLGQSLQQALPLLSLPFAYAWVTLGAGGVLVVPNDTCFASPQPVVYLPHEKMPAPVDVCGAGDTSLAVMLAYLSKVSDNWKEGRIFRHGAYLANIGSGILVGRRGNRILGLHEFPRCGLEFEPPPMESTEQQQHESERVTPVTGSTAPEPETDEPGTVD